MTVLAPSPPTASPVVAEKNAESAGEPDGAEAKAGTEAEDCDGEASEPDEAAADDAREKAAMSLRWE
jgi:hypothetical protein